MKIFKKTCLETTVVTKCLNKITSWSHVMATTHMVSGKAGFSPGLVWNPSPPIAQDIDIDNDGEMYETIIVDLSHMLSQTLGKQMPQAATYRLNYISIGLVNVNDGDDNDSGAFFAGTVDFYSPTMHRIKALKAGRELEKRLESTQVDADSVFFRTEKDYRGYRFNFEFDDDVEHATAETLGAPFTQTEWNMKDIFQAYSLSVNPTGMASNSLWSNRTGNLSKIRWSADILNNSIDDDGLDSNLYQPQINDYVWTAPGGVPIEVLGGLLRISVLETSTDSPEIVDDDYQLRVTIGVTGWSDF